jgi:hypothetical protein
MPEESALAGIGDVPGEGLDVRPGACGTVTDAGLALTANRPCTVAAPAVEGTRRQRQGSATPPATVLPAAPA